MRYNHCFVLLSMPAKVNKLFISDGLNNWASEILYLNSKPLLNTHLVSYGRRFVHPRIDVQQQELPCTWPNLHPVTIIQSDVCGLSPGHLRSLWGYRWAIAGYFVSSILNYFIELLSEELSYMTILFASQKSFRVINQSVCYFVIIEWNVTWCKSSFSFGLNDWLKFCDKLYTDR